MLKSEIRQIKQDVDEFVAKYKDSKDPIVEDAMEILDRVMNMIYDNGSCCVKHCMEEEYFRCGHCQEHCIEPCDGTEKFRDINHGW